jgi:hypothetical protein
MNGTSKEGSNLMQTDKGVEWKIWRELVKRSCASCRASEVILCPILYCIDVFSTYLGEILDFVVVHWSFIFVSHVSRLIVEFI